ncbi:MAG TPA: Asp-tRNA(Asn)/Glu-tRNA(Gln) amidotransferase subunit GatC [Gemmatimonadales bacterium]|jgi:aspartyl/glutamyl-tRNA(Asn/Gln) amidotransferase C subunit|nr:Asp-tRNA(Asn)/Glu-tRNA(Gln) amidotransferase subunit GatC [Gemmatimonadales bacterium]
MTIGRDEVLHAARLAEIAVNEAELETLVAQMGRIVAYVEQLGEVTDDADASGFVAGPGEVRLREDEVRPAALLHPVADMAPEFSQGLFLVPRRGVMEEE